MEHLVRIYSTNDSPDEPSILNCDPKVFSQARGFVEVDSACGLGSFGHGEHIVFAQKNKALAVDFRSVARVSSE